MGQMRTVVLYGTSLGAAAIAAGLADQPGWQMVPIDPASPAASARLREVHPDVVLFDLAAAQPEAVIPLMNQLPDLLLIGLDLTNHQALVLSGEQPRLFTADDFLRLLDSRTLGLEGGRQRDEHS